MQLGVAKLVGRQTNRHREVLGDEVPWLDGITRVNGPERVPVVPSRVEIGRLLRHIDGTLGLMARLRYGTGMRLMECVGLRAKDPNLDRVQEIVKTLLLHEGVFRVPGPRLCASGSRGSGSRRVTQAPSQAEPGARLIGDLVKVLLRQVAGRQ
jgi:integrase